MNLQIATVLDCFAQSLSPTSSGSGITGPTFSWSAPANPPASYTYELRINKDDGSLIWDDNGSNDNGIPSTQESVIYNVNNEASQSALSVGTLYDWQVSIWDANDNSTTQEVTYKP